MKRRLSALGLSFCLLLGQTLPALCCAGGSSSYFSFTTHPDLPLKKFAQGQLGVINPNFARSYLYVAHEILNGRKLTADEQNAAVALWEFRLINDYPDPQQTITPWLTERKKVVPGADPQINPLRSVDEKHPWSEFCNCSANAFYTAAKTLADRITKYGANSDQVREWVNGQDKVFQNCGKKLYDMDTTPQKTVLPAPVKPDAEPWLKADRDYQIAAAYFYAKEFDTARAKFLAIAKDASSPWSDLASYLAARVSVRKASLDPENIDKVALAEAGKQIRSQLEAKPDSAHANDLRDLLGFVEAHCNMQSRLQELTANMGKKLTRQDLDDYSRIFTDVNKIAWDTNGLTGAYKALPAGLCNTDVGDWICTLQTHDASSKEHADAKWQSTKSPLWLVAAMIKAEAKDADCNSLLDAANKIAPDSPAFLTVVYNQIRLLIQSGKKDAALAKLNSVLDQPNLPPSSRNLLLAQRLNFAHTLNDFMRDAAPIPAGISSFGGIEEVPDDVAKMDKSDQFAKLAPLLTETAGKELNVFVPLSILKQAAQAPTVSGLLKRHLTFVVWTRAIVLENGAIVSEVSGSLKTQWPQLAPLLTPVINAPNPDDRRFAAVFLMLKTRTASPFITGGMFDDSDTMGSWWNHDEANQDRKDKDLKPPAFLTPADLEQARKEQSKLTAIETAPNYMTATVIAWSKSHPQDPRVPEALSLAIHATKVGLTDAGTSPLSKEAFSILHKNYPTNPWTKKSPYYY